MALVSSSSHRWALSVRVCASVSGKHLEQYIEHHDDLRALGGQKVTVHVDRSHRAVPPAPTALPSRTPAATTATTTIATVADEETTDVVPRPPRASQDQQFQSDLHALAAHSSHAPDERTAQLLFNSLVA